MYDEMYVSIKNFELWALNVRSLDGIEDQYHTSLNMQLTVDLVTYAFFGPFKNIFVIIEPSYLLQRESQMRS